MISDFLSLSKASESGATSPGVGGRTDPPTPHGDRAVPQGRPWILCEGRTQGSKADAGSQTASFTQTTEGTAGQPVESWDPEVSKVKDNLCLWTSFSLILLILKSLDLTQMKSSCQDRSEASFLSSRALFRENPHRCLEKLEGGIIKQMGFKKMFYRKKVALTVNQAVV